MFGLVLLICRVAITVTTVSHAYFCEFGSCVCMYLDAVPFSVQQKAQTELMMLGSGDSTDFALRALTFVQL